MDIAAWLILRIVFGLFYLSPIKNFLSNWKATQSMVRLIAPWQTNLFAILMIIVMILGGLSIIFGIYARIGGFILLIYNLLGVIVHRKNARLISDLGKSQSMQSKEKINEIVKLGIIGHMTSANKNLVLAAVACFFMLMGSGPWSLIN